MQRQWTTKAWTAALARSAISEVVELDRSMVVDTVVAVSWSWAVTSKIPSRLQVIVTVTG